jgi:hypothetical protein
MVLLLPPAPAARVLLGLTLAARSARSAAAFLRMAVAGPPGALGEAARAVVEPVEAAALTGEAGRGEDCWTQLCQTKVRVVESCDGLGPDGRLLPWSCRLFPIDGNSTVPVGRQLSSDSV